MHRFSRKDEVPIASKVTLTVKEVSALTGVGVGTVRQAIRDKKLIAVTPEEGNRRLLVPRLNVDKWVKGWSSRIVL